MNIVIVNDKVIVNNIELPMPPKSIIHNRNITTVNNNIYVDGYEWKNNKWKRTFKAFWYLWF